MSNYLKLRALAEQLVAITDQLGNDESNSELGDTWSLANDHYVEASESAAVLALISENERLKVVAQKEIDATCESAREVAGARMTLHALQQERDQLKTESAGLKTGYEAYEQVVQGLKAEVEALRKDKDRLDALESNFWDVRHNSHPIADTGDSSSSLEIVGHWMDKPFERVIGEDYNENLRAAIDQAMKAPAYPPARPEYEFEFGEIPDFGGGSGNKARRRAESMGIDYAAALGKEEQHQVT